MVLSLNCINNTKLEDHGGYDMSNAVGIDEIDFSIFKVVYVFSNKYLSSSEVLLNLPKEDVLEELLTLNLVMYIDIMNEHHAIKISKSQSYDIDNYYESIRGLKYICDKEDAIGIEFMVEVDNFFVSRCWRPSLRRR